MLCTLSFDLCTKIGVMIGVMGWKGCVMVSVNVGCVYDVGSCGFVRLVNEWLLCRLF